MTEERLNKQREMDSNQVKELMDELKAVRDAASKKDGESAAEVEEARKRFEADLAAIIKERDHWHKMADDLVEEFNKFKNLQNIKDLLVVKFDISTIDDKMLTSAETKIEDLER